VFRRALHPPVGSTRFWAVQAMVACLALAQVLIDLHATSEAWSVAVEVPVALLVVPVGYAALSEGLSGSAATAAWATAVWILLVAVRHVPDVGPLLVELALVDGVAVLVGHWTERGQMEHERAELAREREQLAQARYRALFEANSSPILVVTADGAVVEANPAAEDLFGPLPGRRLDEVLGTGPPEGAVAAGSRSPDDGVVPVALPTGERRELRVRTAPVLAERGEELVQVVLEDLTEERAARARVRQFGDLVLRVQEDERRRIARELHDDPLQLLIYLTRRLEQVAREPDVPPRVAESLDAARREALGLVDRLRAIAAGLRPPALDELGLLPAIEGLVGEVEEGSGLEVRLVSGGSIGRLPPPVELAAYRIAQEALSNVVRHAGASHAVVEVALVGRELRISVRDDGRGFDPSSAPGGGHLGLLGMRERAELLGGWLAVRSAPGAGTTVEATLPA